MVKRKLSTIFQQLATQEILLNLKHPLQPLRLTLQKHLSTSIMKNEGLTIKQAAKHLAWMLHERFGVRGKLAEQVGLYIQYNRGRTRMALT